MNTETETKIPFALQRWQSNGMINALIRTDAELRQLAGTDYVEAVRHAAIHLTPHGRPTIAGMPERLATIMRNGGDWNPTDAECTETVNALLRDRQIPHWQKQPPILTKKGKHAFTTAQLLAIAGNLHCLAECRDLADLLACFRLMGGYNNFEVEKAVRQFSRFNRQQYLNQDNCNNGGDLFKYSYGWECSHVVYIACNFYMGAKAITPDGRHYEDLTPDAFKAVCHELGGCTDADENDVSDDSPTYVKWRLWWD